MQALVDPDQYAIDHPMVSAAVVGDINGDCQLDTGDIGPFSALLGGPASAASVPEPSTFLLALFALASVVGRRF